jgi:hypothetical protein
MTCVVHDVAVRDVTTKMTVLSEGDTSRMIQNPHCPRFGTKSEGDTGGTRSFILHISGTGPPAGERGSQRHGKCPGQDALL